MARQSDTSFRVPLACVSAIEHAHVLIGPDRFTSWCARFEPDVAMPHTKRARAVARTQCPHCGQELILMVRQHATRDAFEVQVENTAAGGNPHYVATAAGLVSPAVRTTRGDWRPHAVQSRSPIIDGRCGFVPAWRVRSWHRRHHHLFSEDGVVVGAPDAVRISSLTDDELAILLAEEPAMILSALAGEPSEDARVGRLVTLGPARRPRGAESPAAGFRFFDPVPGPAELAAAVRPVLKHVGNEGTIWAIVGPLAKVRLWLTAILGTYTTVLLASFLLRRRGVLYEKWLPTGDWPEGAHILAVIASGLVLCAFIVCCVGVWLGNRAAPRAARRFAPVLHRYVVGVGLTVTVVTVMAIARLVSR